MMPYVMLDENATIRLAIPKSIINWGAIEMSVPAVHYYYCLWNNSLNLTEHERKWISGRIKQDRRLEDKDENGYCYRR
jgi:hypothetical protein